MVGERQIALVLMTAVLLAGVAAGCGGDSGASGATDSSSGAEASSSFRTPGRKGRFAKFGVEADEDEREAASVVLEESIQARAAGEWAKQCGTLTAGRIKRVEESGAAGNCAAGLKVQAAPLSETKALRANTMTGPIDALRVEGDRGFALYHGKAGKDYAMPMREEDGEWKVSSLTETELSN